MNSVLKRLIYGFIFLSFIGVVFYIIFYLFLKPAPTCFDKIKNQGEVDIDCGGPCIPCYIKNASPLKLTKEPLIFKSVSFGKIFYVISVQNPNSEVGSHLFYYKAKFLDNTNNLVGESEGKSTIFPSEEKYIFSDYSDSAYNIERIKKVEVVFDKNIAWSKKSEFLKYDFEIISGPKVSFDERYVSISGSVKNKSIFAVSGLKILAIIFDKFENPIFAAQTLSDKILSYGVYDFRINIPVEIIGLNNIKEIKSKVFLNVEE
jgi:hypothetical protein